jgi:hypothetical protein
VGGRRALAPVAPVLEAEEKAMRGPMLFRFCLPTAGWESLELMLIAQ